MDVRMKRASRMMQQIRVRQTQIMGYIDNTNLGLTMSANDPKQTLNNFNYFGIF